jgi:signal transduction histidine kinase
VSVQVEVPLGSQSRVYRNLPQDTVASKAVPPKATVSRPQQLLELAGKVTRAAWGGIGLLSEGQLVEHLIYGKADTDATQLARASWFVPLVRLIHNSRAPVTLNELAASGLLQESEVRGKESGGLGSSEVGSFLGAPLSSPGLPPLGSFLGLPVNCPGLYEAALYLVRTPEQPPFDAADHDIVMAICGFMEQARVYDGTHLLTRLRLLNQVAQAAAGSLELQRILAVALRELDRHIPLQTGVVWIMDAPEEKTTAAPSFPTASRGPSTRDLVLIATSAPATENANLLGLNVGLRFRLEETPFTACLMEGQAIYSDLGRLAERSCRLAEQLSRGGASAHFAVPLRAGDQCIGLLHSVCTRPSGFTSEQIQLLYLVADLLGPAISNCRLYERLSLAYEELRRAQTHLIQAEKMRALGELAAGMAHDFNNSLCAVLGFLELALLDKALPSPCRSYLESSRTCALDAAQTVHRVQDFARWQRKETKVDLVDINDLVRQTVELTRHKWDRPALAGNGSITVEQYTAAKARVSGNGTELREVLTNLVFNAVDAMPHGGSLVLRSWSSADDVFLSVQDSGVGISDSVRCRLFEPFFTTKGERGNGMGLSVSFGIIQRHNGEITVESTPNQGSTFMIRLPAAEEPAVQAPAVVNQVNATPKLSVASKSLRILVVDDEESIRRFLTAALVQLGHRPRVASTGQEGLAVFSEEVFDVVITDLGLPDISGEELARRLVEQAPQTPVVLLTGWADQIKSETRTIAGVRHVLGKPISLGNLVSTLSALAP